MVSRLSLRTRLLLGVVVLGLLGLVAAEVATYSALQSGITTFDASAGGLGGCPYAKSATGNLATEDLVWLLDGLGIEHGVDLAALVATSAWMAGQLGRPSPSAVVRALSQSDA